MLSLGKRSGSICVTRVTGCLASPRKHHGSRWRLRTYTAPWGGMERYGRHVRNKRKGAVVKTLLWHIPAFVFKTLICFIATAFMSLVGLPMVAVALLAGTRDIPQTATLSSNLPGVGTEKAEAILPVLGQPVRRRPWRFIRRLE